MFYNIEFKINNCVVKLEMWELKAEVDDLSSEELDIRSTVCQELG